MLHMDYQINKDGFQKAKAITKNFAKTFYFSSIFLPKDKQMAAYSIYAICRISDDSVDSQSDNINSAKIDIIIEEALGIKIKAKQISLENLDEDEDVEFKSSVAWDYKSNRKNRDLEYVIAKTI